MAVLPPSNAMAGRPEQAHKAAARLRQLNPTLCVSSLKDLTSPYRRAEYLSQYEEGLRRAGDRMSATSVIGTFRTCRDV
jgi:hypothetical protein